MVFIMDHLRKQSALGKGKHDVQIDEDQNNAQGNSRARAVKFDVPHGCLKLDVRISNRGQ